ncbi:MAG: PHP domain-containing protein [Cellulosilyticaceae bacterium]
MIDLHIHSNFSDGSHTPEAIIQEASRCGLRAIAITDHDTLLGLDAAHAFAKEQNILLIPGIELSTHYQGRELHLLGYGIHTDASSLSDYLSILRTSRLARTHTIIDKLKQCGINISLDQLMTTPHQVVTRAHFAQILLDTGHVQYAKQAFDRFLGEGKPAFVPKESLLSTAEAITLIHEAGGVAVLAHPILYKLNRQRTLSLIDSLRQKGLDGLECYYPAYTPRQTKEFLAICHKHQMIITGGSDFHGTFKPQTSLGKGTTQFDLAHLEPLLTKLSIPKASQIFV